MDIYITAKFKDGNINVAFAMNGRTYGRSFELQKRTTQLEILTWALKEICTSISSGEEQNNENYEIYQDLVKDWHEYFELRYELNETYQVNIDSIESYLPFPGENLYQRVFSKNDTSYHFKEGDFVIARRGKRDDETEEQARANNDSFNLYARILSVDRDADRLYMDKYMSRGFVSCGSKYALPLLEFELHAWYAPMTVEEMKAFREGLTKLMTDPWKYSNVESRETVRETYDKVLEAIQKMEAET